MHMSSPHAVRLQPRITATKLTPHRTRLEYFLEAEFSSPSSGEMRKVEASYKWHNVSAECWRDVPRRVRNKLASQSTHSKKRALIKFDEAALALAKAQERARWHRRQEIKKAAGYPKMSAFDHQIIRAMEGCHGYTARALDRIKKRNAITPGSPQDSPQYVRAHYEGLQRSEHVACAWEARQLDLEGL